MGTTVFERRVPSASVIDHSLEQTRTGAFWIDDLPEELRPDRPPLHGTVTADLVIVGAGYTGLWTALLAKTRDPGRRVVVVEANRTGWAASGRNGGFCESSLTHGHENGANRWPDELPLLDRLGRENLDAIQASEAEYGMDFQFERTGEFAPAIEPHEVAWLEEWAAEGDPDVVFLDQDAAQAAVASPTYLAAVWEKATCGLVHPARLAAELARVAEERGVEIFERSRVQRLDTSGTGVTVVTEHGRVDADQAVLATNVFPSLLKRNRLMTVPVYDYALMTEPLSNAQLDAIGWHDRQGIGDMANQFHYYRLSQDGRILFGGYDALYHYGRRVDPSYEQRPDVWNKLASHFFTTFPQLEGLRFSHQWAGAIDTSTQFTAFFGTARGGRVAYAAGFTGLGVGSTRFAADVMLDLLAGVRNEKTELEMVRGRPLPFPPEPAAAIGINVTRWSLDRADHNQGRRNLLLKTLDKLGLGFDS
ncbi:NAD(P)/FAD-dependent oxidoreductase [Microbacterium telephonicum]|uniref:Glycine/D-amino acid oxidase-like deaminating enzyme n=1 Tax=Microbacterium telephonicum TaxID=1714841 RepID=A0A498CHZ4_9MICO|nr:FAD-dependent oxidoreductase [Microbacterium telephonicum]RLK52650.1 glycine/D-amino acid oxidase-like deaminating enzyme [Microbacterium telephonicum]